MKNDKRATPNQLHQATQELKGIDLGGFVIPTEIASGEKSEYVCVCIKSKDNVSGTAKVHHARLCYAPIDKWREMLSAVKAGIVKGVFNGVFNLVVILNNPTMPEVKPKEEKVKELSPIQKKKVNDLMEDGNGQDDEGLKAIAKEVNVSFARIKAYIKSF